MNDDKGTDEKIVQFADAVVRHRAELQRGGEKIWLRLATCAVLVTGGGAITAGLYGQTRVINVTEAQTLQAVIDYAASQRGIRPQAVRQRVLRRLGVFSVNDLRAAQMTRAIRLAIDEAG